MKILIPDYQFKRILRAYETLAEAYVPDGTNTRATNARRIARKEIAKARRLIQHQTQSRNGTPK